MAKNQTKTEIDVITFFDGEQDAVEVFARLIAERIRNCKPDSPVAEPVENVYNETEAHQKPSGLCG